MELNLRLLFKFGFLLGLLFCTVCNAEDGYGTWHRTLTPFQSHACDSEELLLQCTPNTVISVHYVTYGRQENSGHLCPGSRSYLNGPCDSSKGALQVIHRQCHKSMMCRLHVSPALFGTDNCPGVRKFVEVVYKCRPEEFLNKIVCQGSQMDLFCPPEQGLTIYSATYGTTQSGAPECRQPEGVTPRDCLIDEADETIRSLCSGRQNCSLMADDRTFGNPGCEGTKYLKIAYNCVEKELLLPTIRRSAEETIQTTSFPAWARGIDQSAEHNFWPRSSASEDPALNHGSKLEMQSDEVPTDFKRETLNGNQELVGFMSDWMAAHKHMTGNKEKLILYVSISLTVGFLVFVSLLGGRFVITHLESRRNSHLEPTTQDAEDQFFSDSDLVDHFDPVEMPPPPPLVIVHQAATMTRSATMTRKDSDILPRAPINTGAELNHYFS